MKDMETKTAKVYLPGGFEPEAVVTYIDECGTVRCVAFSSVDAAREYLGTVVGRYGFASMQRLVTASTVDALDTDVENRDLRPAPGEWPACAAGRGEADIKELRRREREAYRCFEDADWKMANALLDEWLDAYRELRDAEGER